MQVLEARDRPGGRILTRDGMDLGPAWIWPGQPRIAAVLKRLGLTPFVQHSTGAVLHEVADGSIRQSRGPGGMDGAMRVPGGFGALTGSLAAALPDGALHLGCRVHSIAQHGETIHLNTSDGPIETECCVMALPPRLAVDLLPDTIDKSIRDALRAVPTWMAGQAKAVATYDRPFWRKAGLSGDAFSRRGPMVEMHDASAKDGPAALFGFLGLPPEYRRDRDAIQDAVLAQFVRLFGRDAASPLTLHLQDWAFDDLTAAAEDRVPPRDHPRYGPLPDPLPGRLILAGSETARAHGGLVEGALEAAEAVVMRLGQAAFPAQVRRRRMAPRTLSGTSAARST